MRVTCFFIIVLFFSNLARCNPVAIFIDFNSTGVSERTIEAPPIISKFSFLELPNLTLTKEVLMGDKAGAAFIESDSLLLMSRPIGNSTNKIKTVTQDFVYLETEGWTETEQLTIPGFVATQDAIKHACVFPALKSGGHFAVTEIYNEGRLTVISFDKKGKRSGEYLVPEKERGHITVYPLADGHGLMQYMPSSLGEGTFVSLIDLDENKELDRVELRENLKKVFLNQKPSQSYFAFMDEGGMGLPFTNLAISKIVSENTTLNASEKKTWMIPYEQKEEILFALTISEEKILIGIGHRDLPVQKIKKLYSYNFTENTAKKVLEFENYPNMFAVTSDGKYLVTVRPDKPQVAVYDAKTYTLLNEKEEISLNPKFVLCP